jgi:hypothetical protein
VLRQDNSGHLRAFQGQQKLYFLCLPSFNRMAKKSKPDQLKSRNKSSSRKRKTIVASKSSIKQKTSTVDNPEKLKNEVRRFKVAETVTKSGVPVLKRKIKA